MFGVLMSHYGTIVLLFITLTIGYIFTFLYEFEFGQVKSRIKLRTLILFASVSYLWYVYTTSGRLFNYLSSIFVINVVLKTLRYINENLSILFASGESEATSSSGQGVLSTVAGHILGSDFPSFTYTFIKFEYMLFAIIGSVYISLILIMQNGKFINRLLNYCGLSLKSQNSVEPTYLLFSLTAPLLLLSTLTPAAVFGIARIFVYVGILLSPFIILGLTHLCGAVSTNGTNIISMILIVVLLIHSGFIATTVTHERSPQPNIDQERILEQGTDWEKYHLYLRMYRSTEFFASDWMDSYTVSNRHVRGFGIRTPLGSFFTVDYISSKSRGAPHLWFGLEYTYGAYPTKAAPSSGYIYISPFEREVSAIPFKTPSSSTTFNSIDKIPINNLTLHKQHRIYANGEVTVHYDYN